MKLSELTTSQVLYEEEIYFYLPAVDDFNDLINPKTDEYFTETINVGGGVHINSHTIFKRLPVRFGKIGGHFNCENLGLISLEGAPREVRGSFSCSNNNLTTLEGAPVKVGMHFSCTANKLTSLEGAPQEVGGLFGCSNNKLTSLEGIHKIIKKINGDFLISQNPIETGGIGLLLIEGITRISYRNTQPRAFDIISKYLGQGKVGLLRCQEELIDNGFEEYAKL